MYVHDKIPDGASQHQKQNHELHKLYFAIRQVNRLTPCKVIMGPSVHLHNMLRRRGGEAWKKKKSTSAVVRERLEGIVVQTEHTPIQHPPVCLADRADVSNLSWGN